MAISSAGYDGTVNEPQWSDLLANGGGRQYGVADAGSWKVTAGIAEREIRIAVGRGFGYGIRDVSDTIVSLSLPAPASGSRYDLIVAHRDWQANTTTFTRVAGSGTQAIPARATTPGTVDDQPLALVRTTAGQSHVTEIIDLRVWGGDGGALAAHELALQYLNRLGTRVIIKGVEWARGFDNFGNPLWRVLDIAPEAYQYNAVNGGGILERGSVAGAGSMITPTAIPAGTLMQLFFSCGIYCPGSVGTRNFNYGGQLTVHRGEIEMGSRRWHNHGVEGTIINPSAMFQWVTTEDIPAGATFTLGVSSDPTSAGGVELWDIFASWGITRP